MHGHGAYSWPGGRKHEGQFSYDKFEGQGCITYEDLHSESGMWKDDIRHGWFTYKYPSGDVKEALWNEGELMNQNEVKNKLNAGKAGN